MKKKIIPLLALALALTACNNPKQPNNQTEPSAKEQVQEVPMATDFTMKTPDGKDLSLMEVVKNNKITIVDFWASWCGPCVASMPELVSLYSEEKANGLGIFGVSLDKDEASWKEAIKQLNMTWPQVSDLQGWDNAAARLYGVQAIPYTMVLDSEGHILAQELRGEDLVRFVKEHLVK